MRRRREVLYSLSVTDGRYDMRTLSPNGTNQSLKTRLCHTADHHQYHTWPNTRVSKHWTISPHLTKVHMAGGAERSAFYFQILVSMRDVTPALLPCVVYLVCPDIGSVEGYISVYIQRRTICWEELIPYLYSLLMTQNHIRHTDMHCTPAPGPPGFELFRYLRSLVGKVWRHRAL